jgi:hypothetical protein
MNYHLNRDGQNLGIFPLEELQRRRDAGQLTGSELVWTQGMATWQPLNSVLPAPTRIAPAASGARKSDSRKILIWVLVIVGLFLAGAVVLGIIGYRMVLRPAINQLTAQSDGNSAGSSPSSAAMIAASAPVVIDPHTKTQADVMKEQREFRIRQYLQGYEQRGQRNPEYDALAEGMISNWIAINYGGDMNTNLPSLAQMGDQLANDPQCNDPLLLTVAAVNAVELHQTIKVLQRAVDAYPTSKHRGYPEFYATTVLATSLINDQEGRQPALDAQGFQYLQNAFTDGSILPGDQAQMADILINGWGSGFFTRNATQVYTMIQQQGDKYRWLALVLEGETEINRAWAARGGGYVNTVSEEGWQGFRQHLAKARECLTRAWKLEPGLPLAPDRMIYVSLGDSDITEMRAWFDRTVVAQIDYADAWSQMRWGLRPRWYGDTDSMLAFGVTALNTRRFDTDVPRKFLDSVGDVEQEMGLQQGRHIYDRDDVWPHLKDLYEGYIAYPSQTGDSRDGWRSTYAVVAYLAGNYEAARQQLQSLNWQPHPWSLTGWWRDLSLMSLEVAARTGPQSNAIEQAENYLHDGNIAGALDAYNQLAGQSGIDAMTASFIQERQYSLIAEKKLQAGQWIPFLPDDDHYIGWQTNFGSFKSLPDGSLQVSSDENGHMLYSRIPVGTDFEIRGTFDVIKTSNNAFQAGVVMGVPQFNTYDWYAFRVKHNHEEGDVASFSQHWTRRQVLATVPNIDSHTNSFDFRYNNGFVTASVNGRQVFDNITPPKDSYVGTNEFLVGLGAFNNSDSTTLRYHDVQLRTFKNP